MPSKPKGDSQAHSGPQPDSPWARVPSTAIEISHEPALQHKKRVEGPPSSFSLNLDEGDYKYKASDDFALLGKQDKFASNVRYGLKPSNTGRAPSKEKKVNSNNNNNNNNNNNSSANVPPPPKQMKMAERQSRSRRKQDPAEARPKKGASKENVTPNSPPPAPRKDREDNQKTEKEGLKDKNLADILPKSKSAFRKEAAQTDTDKGITQSNLEAPADYSLQYKAGVAPARPVRKPSEYQKEFTWKKAFPASPLLSAEQILHKSNTEISPIKKAVIPKRTEYQAQFKTYKMSEPVSLAPKPSQEAPVQRGRSKTQIKRSKSVGAFLSPDRGVAAGSAPVTSADDPRLLRESCNNSPVPKVPVNHGKIKHRMSEYRSNYKSPTRFGYEGGAWKDAFPAHLLQSKNGSESKEERKAALKEKEKEEEPLSNWFAEVLELRRRATEYKRRAQGTHFSREHLVQLMARQTGYWEDDTARSSRVSSLDALALEPARPAGVPSFTRKEQAAVDKMSMMAVRGDSPIDDDDDDDVSSTVRNNLRPAKKGGKRGKKSKMAWQDASEAVEDLNTNQNAAYDSQSTGDVDEMEAEDTGPTPLLRQIREKSQRHHLDRTTPSVGGVLLSAPARQQTSAHSGSSIDTLTESQDSPMPKFSTERLNTSPLLGKPTPDTHFLRDEDAYSDRAMSVQYISSPPVSLAKSDRNLKALQRRMNAKIPATIDERMGETYQKDVGTFEVDDLPLVKTRNTDDDDDVLSVSARSIASSCSLASEVYERARRRRDQFWGKADK